jgi:hypothetical protein
MSKSVIVQEWYSDLFHQKVLDFEKDGYVARWDTYKITPEMNPETGAILHLYSIELIHQ